MKYEFVVEGHPAPAGSKRIIPVGKRPPAGAVDGRPRVLVDANKNAGKFKTKVKKAAKACRGDGPMFEGPVKVTMVFYRKRPDNQVSSDGGLKSNFQQYPIGAPDALKLARGVEDAMTGVIYRDDAQIVDEHLYKRWGEPKVAVRVEALSGPGV